MGTMLNIDLDEDHPPSQAASDAATVIDEDAPLAGSTMPADVVDEDDSPLDEMPAHAIRNANGTVTLPLKHPRDLKIRKNGTIRTDRYDRLTLHRLAGADLNAIKVAPEDKQDVVALARSAKLSQAVMNALFEKMDAADIAAAGRVLNSFFESGRKTRK